MQTHATTHSRDRWQTFEKMKRIILVIIIFYFSCEENDKNNIASELKNNTFDLILSSPVKDTVVIEFKDSTYTVFENKGRNLPWKITSLDNSKFLVLNNNVIKIKRTRENTYKGIAIGKKNQKIFLTKRKIDFNRELLNGIWVEEKYYNSNISQFPLPPPPPNISEKDYEWPPFYKIANDKISFNYYYKSSYSDIKFSSSNEFIDMSLSSNDVKLELLWRIKKLNDSLMIVDKQIIKNNNSSEKMKDIKLKKR